SDNVFGVIPSPVKVGLTWDFQKANRTATIIRKKPMMGHLTMIDNEERFSHSGAVDGTLSNGCAAGDRAAMRQTRWTKPLPRGPGYGLFASLGCLARRPIVGFRLADWYLS